MRVATSPLDCRSPRHVFGPVPSRRLGRSLGVDLVPFKTCSYDCIYCQVGRTTNQTIERKEWVPMDAVLDELKVKLACRPDYVTLSGSGEPTLHSRLGETIEHIQAMSDVPVAVLTNGSLLWQKEVREELALADAVLPSLDAGNGLKFAFINRPHPCLTFERMVEGLIAFRDEFPGQYWLEVFLLGGYTAILVAPLRGSLSEFKQAIRKARQIVYLTDNTGEIVFDRDLLSHLPLGSFTVVVRGGPVLNDATLADARQAGLAEFCDLATNGSDAPGTLLEDCSPEFRTLFAAADLVIAKGQGNYESLIGVDQEIFFLLTVKCPVLAESLGWPRGSLVLHHQGRSENARKQAHANTESVP